MRNKDKNKNNQKRGKLAQLLGGDVLGSRFVLKQIPLVLLILVMCLVLVAVRYRVESLTKEKSALQSKVSYMREVRVQMRKQYQESIRISRIDRDLDTIGVGLVAGPPYELKVNKYNNEK